MLEPVTSAVPIKRAFPILPLLALAMSGFLAIVTETLPAGLLSVISSDFHLPASLAGQMISVYALGSTLAAIPLTTATQGYRRRPVLLCGVIGFLAMNTLTACATRFDILLVARFFAGLAAGLIWGLQAGYARRLVDDSQKGRALTLALMGIPLAFSIGTPAGTALGELIGWRSAFACVSVFALVLAIWIFVRMPDLPGQLPLHRASPRGVFKIPGIRIVLLLTLTWIGAHNILYTYLAPFVERAHLESSISEILLLFGFSALGGLCFTGIFVDRHLRTLTLASLMLFGFADLMICTVGTNPVIVWVAVLLWGLSYGGSGSLIQFGSAEVAGEGIDIASAMISTVWNLSITLAGIGGGIVLRQFGVIGIPWSMMPIIILAWIIIQYGASGAFAPRRKNLGET